MRYLSKSDFKVARTCPAKLFFKKERYHSLFDDDEYMRFLADGGFMVETIAKLLYPEGIEVGYDAGPEVAFKETLTALDAVNVTLFEATLISDGKLARVDILRKRGDCLDLIEVKAKSINSSETSEHFRGTRHNIKAAWQPYLEDVGFQTHICEQLFPKSTIVPFLCLVDRGISTTIDSIHACFLLTAHAPGQQFRRPQVTFDGDRLKLRENHFLTTINVRSEVDELMPIIVSEAKRLSDSVQTGEQIKVPLSTNCRSCEYRLDQVPADGRDGFRECWGQLADESPHILDYYHVSSIGGRGGPIVNRLLAAGHAKLSDVDDRALVKADGSIGPVAARQLVQRQYTLSNREYFSAQLVDILDSHAYPLHFVDFETSRVAVPYHAGMHPYEQVAFQWSCHTLCEPGGPVEHAAWINVADTYPNFEFARTLRSQLNQGGTVYIWSHHETAVLADIRRQMDAYRIDDEALALWLTQILNRQSGIQIVDLCELAKSHYFHPLMKGKLSMKYVLPAVWSTDESLHRREPFVRYCCRDAQGRLIDPYKTLPPLPFPDVGTEMVEEVVSEGTGAMRAYQEMLYGPTKYDMETRDQWRRLLLQYCELDTAAMLMIWLHWHQGARVA